MRLQKMIPVLLVMVLAASVFPVSTARAAEAGGVQTAMNQILSDYPSGSFFTVNGQACTHGARQTCSNCSLKAICRAKGKSLSSGQGDAWTCIGFASYVMNQVFGVNITEKTKVSNKGPSNAAATFQAAKVGDLIYFYRSNQSFGHAAVCMGVTDDSVTLLDCNAGKRCEVLYRTIPYAQMRRYYSSYEYCSVYRANTYDSVNGAATPQKQYTVHFNANGGSVSQTAKTVTAGNFVGKMPTPDRQGYTFVGWELENSNLMLLYGNELIVDQDITLYAIWREEITACIVDFDANGGSVSQSSQTVTPGLPYGTLPIPTKSGCTFEGWYTARSGGTLVDNSTTAGNSARVTLYAHWKTDGQEGAGDSGGQPFYIILDDGSTCSRFPMTAGEHNMSLPQPTREGSVFEGWYTQSAGGTQITDSTVFDLVSGQTLYAHWGKGGHWGPWSDWASTPVEASGTREVEVRSKQVSDGRTEYRYGRYIDSTGGHDCWCGMYLEGLSYVSGSAALQYSDWSAQQYATSGKEWSCGYCNGNHMGVGHYGADGRAWWKEYLLPSGSYYWEESRWVDAVYETQYQYRDWITD